MSTPDWISLFVFLFLVSVLAWLILLILWLAWRLASRIALRSWDIRQYLVRWLIGWLILAVCASYSGFWLTDVAIPPAGADDAAIKAYHIGVTKGSFETLFYAFGLMTIHVTWQYLCLAFGLLTGRYPIAQADAQQ